MTARGRVLLVGESNPYSGDPDDALLPWPANAAGDRLRRILGMGMDEYLAAFPLRRNLLLPGSAASRAVYEMNARALLSEHRPQLVVALGRKVTMAFSRALELEGGLAAFEWYLPVRVETAALLSLPHPSGRCRAWNAWDAKENARAQLREARTKTGCIG